MAFNQPLAGLVEPAARSWRSARPADRLAFYREAGRRAVAEKRAELARAIGSNGRRMKARKHPRADGADGPVMTPHDDRSRTARLLDSRPTASGVTLFWHSGIGKGQRTPWGSILAFHARGAGYLPARDVRLSRRGVGAVRRGMAAWWTSHLRKATRARNAAQKSAPPKPGIVPRLKAAIRRIRGG